MSVDRLAGTVAALWPGASVVPVRDGQPSAGATVLVAVPNARDPRLLVPAGLPGAAGRAMWRFSDALTPRERARRLAGATGLRLGLEPLLRDRVELRGAEQAGETVEERLSTLLGRRVRVSVGVGSPRANQKPVLQAYDDRGRTVAFVKVGDTSRNAELVRGEAAALARVGSRPWRTLLTPRLLHHETWQGMELLVMSPLPSTPRPRLGTVARPPAAAAAEIAAAFPGGSPALAQSVFLSRLREVANTGETDGAGAGGEDVAAMRAELAAVLDRVTDRFGDDRVTMGAWHGDFAPWNMSWHRRRLVLWDWEQFATDVPVGLDRVHYHVHTSARAHGFTAPVLETAVAASGTGTRLPTLYLAAITARYLQGIDEPQGSVLHDPVSVLLDVLRRRLAAGRRDT